MNEGTRMPSSFSSDYITFSYWMHSECSDTQFADEETALGKGRLIQGHWHLGFLLWSGS